MSFEISLEKFGSVGGDNFEIIVAMALDDLGLKYGTDYLASWDKLCVPGTFIEADFIIGPLDNPHVVLAVGHATSENSAGMKFHRDMEQLFEVKALPNGENIRVYEILFGMRRATHGGFSDEQIEVMKRSFDGHLNVFEHDWGMTLLYYILESGVKSNSDRDALKEQWRKLINRNKAFVGAYSSFLQAMRDLLNQPESTSELESLFTLFRSEYEERKNMELLIEGGETSYYKRALNYVCALHPYELRVLYRLGTGDEVKVLEDALSAEGISVEKAVTIYERFDIMSAQLFSEWTPDCRRIGRSTVTHCKLSNELNFLFKKFDADALALLQTNIATVAPNLRAYALDLLNLNRVTVTLIKLQDIILKGSFELFYDELLSNFNSSLYLGFESPRLLVFEVAFSILVNKETSFSYDVLANESGNFKLIKNPFDMRFIAGKRQNPTRPHIVDGYKALWNRLIRLPKKYIDENRDDIIRKFIYRRFDGMMKQPHKSVLDALIASQIYVFANSIGAAVDNRINNQKSCLNVFVNSEHAGFNVEIPYVLVLPDCKKIFIHRVMAEGGSGHKRKEFASKIRTIRFDADDSGIFDDRADYYASVLLIDGKWINPSEEEPLMPIRMLTIAGWDYVVYPEGFKEAFEKIRSRLISDGIISAV